MSDWEVRQGDCLDLLRQMPDASVNCCVTSPPYFGLRDYGVDGQIGLEDTSDAYIARLVAVFAEVRRVLRDDGTLWVNIGDSYSGAANSGGVGKQDSQYRGVGLPAFAGKPKDLTGIPWMLAFALRADGWYLRQDIIWAKPNPMPESVTDRCTKSHEYIFLLSKSARYHYDQEAIAEPVAVSTVARLSQPGLAMQAGSDRVPGKTNGTMKAVGPRIGGNKYGDSDDPAHATKSGNVVDIPALDGKRNKRSVWTVATQPFSEAHFAVYPPALIRPCILAGCPPGGVVLDPFTGSGTTGVVAVGEGRRFVGCELNPEYAAMARRRICNAQPSLFGMAAQ